VSDSSSARSRWNHRYLSQDSHDGPAPAPWLVEQQVWLPAAGLAFDVAMGLGGSAGWLIERGWRAAGADIAEAGVRRAKARWPALLAFVADLERFTLPERTFDLILNFHYLDRALWPQFRLALKPGGLLFMETFVRAPDWDEQGMNPAYLLEPGELRAAFGGWDVLAYREAERAGRQVESLVARTR
jgi:tellurite methyltransferase